MSGEIKNHATPFSHKQNLHTHSTYVDGKDTPEELILEAIQREFGAIGFSEHSYLECSPFPNRLTLDRMEQYKKEIKELKSKYRDRIQIFCGLEYEFFSNLDTEDLDYLIGSVHYLDCDGRVVTFDLGLNETLDYIKEYYIL